MCHASFPGEFHDGRHRAAGLYPRSASDYIYLPRRVRQPGTAFLSQQGHWGRCRQQKSVRLPEVPATLSLGHMLDCPRVLDGFPNFQLNVVNYPQIPAGPVPSAVQTIPLVGSHPPPIRGNSTSQKCEYCQDGDLLGHPELRGLHWTSSLSIQQQIVTAQKTKGELPFWEQLFPQQTTLVN